ncbi:MAG: YeeE/YedE family protein [Alphaproteobacteria bacterium]|nr:YeeE/YedE family protein [Alphaproteobacteria bacterium]
MADLHVHIVVAAGGFAAGMVFGATAERTNFCTMGAIADLVLLGQANRFRAWLLAIAVALLGSQALHLAGIVDLGRSIYQTPSLDWAGAILGGLSFGFGMTLAGGCGNKTLVRIGGGSLKSLVVFLCLGLAAYATLRGILGALRLPFEAAFNLDLSRLGVARQGIVDLLARCTGVAPGGIRIAATLLAAGALFYACFRDPAFRASGRDIAAGLIIGSLVPAGWLITGVLGLDDFEPTPLASFTFVAPIGDTLQYAMTYTGAKIGFGVAAVLGVIAGAFVSASAAGQFRLEGFADTADTLRHILGGMMMGVGGVLALGCTIGQGITGLSTLALGSVIAWLSIVAGGWLGVRYLEEGSLRAAFRRLAA